MTLGELAQALQRGEQDWRRSDRGSDANWTRDEWFDATGLPWINPSPNMRNLIQATLYPGIGAIEGTNISVGRGTDTPFEQVGAPWIDGVALADALNTRGDSGHSLLPGPLHADLEQVRERGMRRRVHDRDRPQRASAGSGRRRRSPRRCTSCTARSTSSRRPSSCLARRKGSRRFAPATIRSTIVTRWAAGEARWRLVRANYLLYR